jgi:hypothetical protein
MATFAPTRPVPAGAFFCRFTAAANLGLSWCRSAPASPGCACAPYWHESRVLAVELEQVERVEHCGGVVPVSADEVENGEAAFVRRASSEGMGEINQRTFAPTGNGGRDAPSSPARERRSPAGAALGTDSFLASDGFLAAFLPTASFAEVAGGAAGISACGPH